MRGFWKKVFLQDGRPEEFSCALSDIFLEPSNFFSLTAQALLPSV
jgi:hypothetical protein